MRTFTLKIVTPDGVAYDDQAEGLSVRTTSGELGILAGHTNLVAPLVMGRCSVIIDGKRSYGNCNGGMVSVMDGAVTLISSFFGWNQ